LSLGRSLRKGKTSGRQEMAPRKPVGAMAVHDGMLAAAAHPIQSIFWT
jgi:hypothetical protein